MFKSREQREYDAKLESLTREKEALQAQAAALAEQDVQQGYPETHRPRGELPLAYWMGWKIAQETRGSARLDLVRPRFQAAEPGNLLRRRVAPTAPQASYQSNNRRRQPYHDDYHPRPLLGFGQGARIKIMRHIDFGVPDQYRRRRTQLEREADQYDSRGLSKKGFMGNSDRQPLLQHEPDVGAAVSSISNALRDNFKPPEKPLFDFGAGVNLELDEGSLAPALRLKVKDFFSIKILPEPMFKIQKRLNFGPGTPLGLRVNYELPLADARNLWAPPARLMVRFDNTAGGLKFGPGGADFDEHVLQLGRSTAVRAALSVDFPRTLPLEEGEKIFGWRASRLGVKTRW